MPLDDNKDKAKADFKAANEPQREKAFKYAFTKPMGHAGSGWRHV